MQERDLLRLPDREERSQLEVVQEELSVLKQTLKAHQTKAKLTEGNTNLAHLAQLTWLSDVHRSVAQTEQNFKQGKQGTQRSTHKPREGMLMPAARLQPAITRVLCDLPTRQIRLSELEEREKSWKLKLQRELRLRDVKAKARAKAKAAKAQQNGTGVV